MKDVKDLILSVSTMTPWENFNMETFTFTLHGCLAVQEMLNFKKPINVVNGLLEMNDSILLKLLCDSKGCHVTDAFIGSPYVGEKNKDKLFRKLQVRSLVLLLFPSSLSLSPFLSYIIPPYSSPRYLLIIFYFFCCIESLLKMSLSALFVF